MAIRILLSRKLGELRWTQSDLARRTGIRPSTINEMYHELCDRVNIEYLDRICNVLNCDLNEILIYIPPQNRQETIKMYKTSMKKTDIWCQSFCCVMENSDFIGKRKIYVKLLYYVIFDNNA